MDEFLKQNQFNTFSRFKIKSARKYREVHLYHFTRASYFRVEAAKMNYLFFSINLSLKLHMFIVSTLLRLFYRYFIFIFYFLS